MPTQPASTDEEFNKKKKEFEKIRTELDKDEYRTILHEAKRRDSNRRDFRGFPVGNVWNELSRDIDLAFNAACDRFKWNQGRAERLRNIDDLTLYLNGLKNLHDAISILKNRDTSNLDNNQKELLKSLIEDTTELYTNSQDLGLGYINEIMKDKSAEGTEHMRLLTQSINAYSSMVKDPSETNQKQLIGVLSNVNEKLEKSIQNEAKWDKEIRFYHKIEMAVLAFLTVIALPTIIGSFVAFGVLQARKQSENERRHIRSQTTTKDERMQQVEITKKAEKGLKKGQQIGIFSAAAKNPTTLNRDDSLKTGHGSTHHQTTSKRHKSGH